MTAPSPDPSQLDSWLRIEADGSVVVRTGKVELGTGTRTALAQIVAEELDAAAHACRAPHRLGGRAEGGPSHGIVEGEARGVRAGHG